jgi:hypothetical protein
MTNFTDCQDEYPGRPRPLRARQDRDYCAAFVAMGEIAEAARAFQKIEGIAALAGTRIAIHRRRDTRVRG